MGAYLLEHPNPNAPQRGDGRYHGYRDRQGVKPRLIVIHTTESAFDVTGPDSGAENVARYQSTVERPSSYHLIADSDSSVPMLPYDHTAFGARGFNTVAIHLAFAGVAADWPKLTDVQLEARLRMLAGDAAAAAAEYGIPIRCITGDQAAGGAAGFCGHGDLDPDRRTDPGPEFPWGRFLELVQGGTTPQSTKPTPAARPTRQPTRTTSWTEQAVNDLPTLKQRTDLGRRSPDDARLQGLLVAAGHLDLARNVSGGKLDGKFGPSTTSAVRAAQRAHGLTTDGIVGRNTWTALLGL